MISIINCENICTVCETPFIHKRRGFKLLGDVLPTIFFITSHERCCRGLKYKTLRNLIYSFFLENNIRVLDLEEQQ